MTDLSITTRLRAGATFQDEIRTVIVNQGARGPRGLDGPQGDPGEPGASITLRGNWTAGTVYCPLDAVTSRSTAAQGILSLFIQRSNVACAPSTVEPHLEPGRWDEIGATDLQNVTGAIWTIDQPGHGFSYIGTPVTFDPVALRWVQASSRVGDNAAIAVVREVRDARFAVLQSSGEVPNIDPRVIWPDGSDWQAGAPYFVSERNGRLELRTPTDNALFRQPLLIPTRNHVSVTDPAEPGSVVGTLLPWTPTAARQDVIAINGITKFFYRGEDGGDPDRRMFQGPDRQGNTLTFVPGDLNLVDVFVNGVNLADVDPRAGEGYQAFPDGARIQLERDPALDDRIEIWAYDLPSSTFIPSVAQKLDPIEQLFDGTRTDFPLTIGGGVLLTRPDEEAASLYIDNHPQEPRIDFTTLEDPGDPLASLVRFTQAPQVGDRFWGVVGVPATDAPTGVAARIDALGEEAKDLEERARTFSDRLRAIEDWACAHFQGHRKPPWCQPTENRSEDP
jgi:hypothetical protein